MNRPLWLTAIALTLIIGGTTVLHSSGITSAAYSLIKNAGSALTQRPTLNFVSGTTCVDNAGANRTDCTSSGGGSSFYQTIQTAGTPLAQEPVLNFAANVTCTDNPGVATNCTPSGSSGSGSGGISTYSAPAITLPAAGTTFFPPGGGGLPSSTESNVSVGTPAVPIGPGFYVNLSAAIGTGNTIAFTIRDAGASTAITCTISGAGTTCFDTTHTFTPTAGDKLDIQAVTTGIVAIAPTIVIAYATGSAGGGGGGAIPHHQYYVAAIASGSAGFSSTWNNNSVGTSFLSSTGFGVMGAFGSGGTSTSQPPAITAFLPSTWTGSITMSVDALTSTNDTGNFSLTPEFFCIPNGTDIGAAATWTVGSNVAVAAPGGAGTGFYREKIVLTYSGSGCSAGQSIQLGIFRPSGDTYAHNIVVIGADVSITY
jgi:hypothetical protein